MSDIRVIALLKHRYDIISYVKSLVVLNSVHHHPSSLHRSMRTSSWIKIIDHSMHHSSLYEICHDLKSIGRHNCVDLLVLPLHHLHHLIMPQTTLPMALESSTCNPTPLSSHSSFCIYTPMQYSVHPHIPYSRTVPLLMELVVHSSFHKRRTWHSWNVYDTAHSEQCILEQLKFVNGAMVICSRSVRNDWFVGIAILVLLLLLHHYYYHLPFQHHHPLSLLPCPD
mmetsp:Transcript_23802/g.47250  ORF Transcript_23802/g.47250 Transcript_23802/m.47250 type:complete len:225 (-) Transcript_23802:1063-1737(-)